MEIVLNISKLILSQEAANNNQDDGMKKEAENISKENQLKKDEWIKYWKNLNNQLKSDKKHIRAMKCDIYKCINLFSNNFCA